MKTLAQRVQFLFTTVVILLFTSQISQAQSINAFYDDVDAFMSKYVDNGLVAYGVIKDKPAELDALLAQIAILDRTSLSAADEKAYMINAYNVLVIKNIIDHYPTASPTAENGFFDRDKFQVSGKSQTLDELEKGDLYVKYPDARLHFVLVCAALGCPLLVEDAYRGDILETQLDTRTKHTLNSEFYVNVSSDGSRVDVSELFSWYTDDFTKDGLSVVGYLNQYRKDSLPENIKVGFIKYDWTLNDDKTKGMTGSLDVLETDPGNTLLQGQNLQALTPSTLLVPGQVDVKVFNNLYTQTAFFDDGGSRVDTDRWTFFTSIISFQVGITERLNLGLDLYPKAVRVGDPGSSPLSVLQFSTNNNANAALAALAPKIKFNPLKNVPNLAAQVALYLPLTSDLEGSQSGRPFLDYDDTQLWAQAFYDLPFNEALLLYLEGGVFFRNDSASENANNEFIFPFKGILNYFVNDRLTVYGLTEFTPSSLEQDASLFSTLYTQVGAGVKFQVTPRFEIETLATIFPFGYNKGAGQTYNFGFRYVR
ncbi:MAG: DUF547 domain-containing protein [Bacteroidota bacterium]